MSFHKIELFGHIAYSPDLSYHELLEREEAVKNTVQAALEKREGAFIHFEALGDALRFQCVLPEKWEDAFHAVCDDLAPSMRDGLDARLLMIDKDLDILYSYVITSGKWQEACIGLPPAGKLAEASPVKLGRLPTGHATGEKKK